MAKKTNTRASKSTVVRCRVTKPKIVKRKPTKTRSVKPKTIKGRIDKRYKRKQCTKTNGTRDMRTILR
jgi:hypothetical protein